MNAVTETVTPKRPGRPKRAETMQNERRRRKGGTTHKLAIPKEVQSAHPDMEFRWGRDDGARMQKLTVNDDWDKVPGVEPIHGGRGEDGKGMKMHLLMKPKSFLAEDRAEKEAEIKALEEAQLSRPDAKTATETGADMYSVPGNKI